jgi:predicted nucleic acid-binding protein
VRSHTSVGHVATSAAAAYEALLDHVLSHCSRGRRLDDATKGYLERNLRRALLALFRAHGPIDPDADPIAVAESSQADLLRLICRDLPDQLGRSALTALVAYTALPESWVSLAPFVRSYSALAIRNVDPLGRRWQQQVLARTTIALDTDAVLNLLVEDLPEHGALLRAARQLKATGIKVVVSEAVLEEAAGHLSRANRTFRRFARSLPRMSEAMVDATVWHAVVRGYYYATQREQELAWRTYWNRYFDRNNPVEYVRAALRRRIEYEVASLDTIPGAWLPVLEELTSALLERKERIRWKAEFRSEEDMQRRTLADVRMAMHLATLEGADARGYLASEDRGFIAMERHSAWRRVSMT